MLVSTACVPKFRRRSRYVFHSYYFTNHSLQLSVFVGLIHNFKDTFFFKKIAFYHPRVKTVDDRLLLLMVHKEIIQVLFIWPAVLMIWP